MPLLRWTECGVIWLMKVPVTCCTFIFLKFPSWSLHAESLTAELAGVGFQCRHWSAEPHRAGSKSTEGETPARNGDGSFQNRC